MTVDARPDAQPEPACGTAPLGSVTNALRILETFSHSRSQGVSELARMLKLGKSTTHRILVTLEAQGFVEQGEDGRYRLGVRVYELGSAMVCSLELRAVAHSILERLRTRTNETAHLSILEGTEVVFIDRFESEAALRLFTRLGKRMPAHATSTGKAILAHSPPAVVEAVISAGLKPLTPYTVATRSAFLQALAEARSQGWIASVDQSEVGITSVGAPIFDRCGKAIAAVSIAGQTIRLEPSLYGWGQVVKQAAFDISSAMGYREGQPYKPHEAKLCAHPSPLDE